MAYHREIDIPFQEIDAAGRLFFAHLFHHAHEAYEAFLTHLGLPLEGWLDGSDIHLPLVHAEADYYRPIGLGERIGVEVTVRRLGRRSFTLRHRFLGADGQPRAMVETVHAAADGASGGGRPLPRVLRRALEPHLVAG